MGKAEGVASGGAIDQGGVAAEYAKGTHLVLGAQYLLDEYAVGEQENSRHRREQLPRRTHQHVLVDYGAVFHADGRVETGDGAA